MTTSTLVHGMDRHDENASPPRPPLTEWLLAMGSVVHRLDYGGRVAALDCVDARSTALLAAAYPLATLDAVAPDAVAAEASRHALRRAGAQARCELEVGGPELLAAGSYDLVCFLHGLAEHPDPVGSARAALRAVRPTGALMVVEHSRSDSFADGPVAVGAWLLRAGVARVRLAAATSRGFVLDARPTP
jgi:SAM-dependent methyltransferase